jgi:hypothetical protein
MGRGYHVCTVQPPAALSDTMTHEAHDTPVLPPAPQGTESLDWARVAALGGLVSLLAACAAPGGRLGRSLPLQRPDQHHPSAHSPQEAARFLLQAQFSASDAELAAVQKQGYAAWLAQQFDAPLGRLTTPRATSTTSTPATTWSGTSS